MTIRPGLPFTVQGSRGRKQKIPGIPQAGYVMTPAGWVAQSVANVAGLQTALDAKQPLDSDLTAIAALGTTSFGRAFLTQADAPSSRTYIGAGTSSFSGAFSALSGIPTTISGYGITDAYTKTANDTLLAAKQDVSAKGSASGYASLDGSGLIPTSQIPLAYPTWVKYTVGFAALSAAGLTNDIELFSLPAKGFIHAVQINPVIAFTGGVIASYTLSVGNAGLLTKYAVAQSVFTVAVQTPQVLAGVESMSVATSIRVAAVSTVGLLNAATAGSADIYVLRSVLP